MVRESSSVVWLSATPTAHMAAAIPDFALPHTRLGIRRRDGGHFRAGRSGRHWLARLLAVACGAADER